MAATDRIDPYQFLLRLTAYVNQSPPVAPQRLKIFVASMASDPDPLPRDAFCEASLRYLFDHHDWFPSYAKLHGDLRAWWAEHRPPDPRLMQNGRDTLSRADATAHLNYMQRRETLLPLRQDWPIPALDPLGYAACDLGRLDSFMQAHCPGAWALIEQQRQVPLLPKPPTTESPLRLIAEMGNRLRHPDAERRRSPDQPEPDRSATNHSARLDEQEAARAARFKRGNDMPA